MKQSSQINRDLKPLLFKMMFENYLSFVQEAKEKEQEIVEKYDKLKEQLALEVQEKTVKEMKNIEETLYKDYSPLEFHKMLTVIVNNHTKLDQDKKKELENVKEDLDNKLNNIINVSEPKPKVTEMYKTIGKTLEINNYICRVWFTLVDTELCKEGDPIRIEWLDFNIPSKQRLDDVNDSITCTSVRYAVGKDGINMPRFDGIGKITYANNTFSRSYSFPTDSDEIKNFRVAWWDEWVEKNRPIKNENY